MEMSNTRLVPAPRERVWEALNDPQTLKACIPGCESFERDGDNAYRATVAARVGPVSARFAGRLELADVTPPESYTIRFQGQGGAAGFANGEATVRLTPAEGDQTSLAYTAKATVGGKLAQIGSRLVDGAAAKLAEDFFARFVNQVAPPAEAVPAAAEADELAPATPQAQAQGAGRWVRVLAIGAMIILLIWLYAKGGGS
jgi:carbon monoxide dehydrogenase subunit G